MNRTMQTALWMLGVLAGCAGPATPDASSPADVASPTTGSEAAANAESTRDDY